MRSFANFAKAFAAWGSCGFFVLGGLVCRCFETLSFSRMRSEGFSFNFGSLRVELCSPVVVLVFASDRNRPQVFESGSCGPAVGESSKK